MRPRKVRLRRRRRAAPANEQPARICSRSQASVGKLPSWPQFATFYGVCAWCPAGLASPDGRSVRLDRLLHGALFNKKEAEQEGSSVAEGELLKRLLGKLQLHHRLLRPSEQVGRP
jgi:hypothetical protein